VKAGPALAKLLRSAEPAVRLKTRVGVLGEDPGSRRVVALRAEVRECPRVRKLLSKRDSAGRLLKARAPYAKWEGAHWVLATLADLGYPEGDDSLRPVADRVLGAWLGPRYETDVILDGRTTSPRALGVPLIRGRYRRCASQQGNALHSALRLGLEDERVDRLARLLLKWQWPDGGWNCDRRPEADASSVHETWIPLRGLALYGARRRSAEAAEAAKKAAEVLLSRRVYRRRSDGGPIDAGFLELHYPPYWRYDLLASLKALAEAGFVRDPRCADALDVLESKRLADGGWPAEARHYRADSELVDWGPTGARRANEWVTCDALAILRAAGRLEI
jgi:hypothetical protein